MTLSTFECVIVCLVIIAVWAIIHKILNNRRTVVRHVLHGTVTYTIKGYDGPEARRIAEALRYGGPKAVHDTPEPDELEHRLDTLLTKATSEDVRR